MEWKVPEDQNSLSELLDRAESEGPQRIQRRGKRFLVLVENTEHETENQLVRAFLDEPEFTDINIDRIDAPMRDLKP